MINLHNDNFSSRTREAMMSDMGIVYVCLGDEYLKFVEFSIRTLRLAGCKLPVTVFVSDIKSHNMGLNFPNLSGTCIIESKEVADGVSQHAYSRRMKIEALDRSPYMLTLYVDADTAFKSEPDRIFDYLKSNDFVVSTNAKLKYDDYDDRRPDCSKLVALTDPESLNTGVILLKRNDASNRLLEIWRANLLRRQNDATIESIWKRLSDQEALQDIFSNGSMKVNFGIMPNTVWNAQDVIWFELSRENKWNDIVILHSPLCFERKCTDISLVNDRYCQRFFISM